MNPLPCSTEDKFKTTKTFTYDNTPDKGLLVKISFEYTHTPNDHYPRKNAQICTKYCIKAFCDRVMPDTLGEFTALPRSCSWIKGKGRNGRMERRGKGRKGKRLKRMGG